MGGVRFIHHFIYKCGMKIRSKKLNPKLIMCFSISAFDVPRTESTTTTKLLNTEAPHLLFLNLKSKEVLMFTRGLFSFAVSESKI